MSALPPARGPGSAVEVRFTPSPVPVLTSTPGCRTGAIRAARRCLDALGRSYLGGHLDIVAGPPPATPRERQALAAGERLASERAVADALRGGPGTARLPLPPDAAPSPTPRKR